MSFIKKNLIWIVLIAIAVYVFTRYVPLATGKTVDTTYKAPRY